MKTPAQTLGESLAEYLMLSVVAVEGQPVRYRTEDGPKTATELYAAIKAMLEGQL